MPIKILKENALDQLKGRWIKSIFTLIMYTIILRSSSTIVSILLSAKHEQLLAIIQFIVLSLIITMFLTGVMRAGRCRFFLNMTEDYHSARFLDLFSQFKIYPKTLLLSLLVQIFSGLWYIPIIVVALIIISIYMISQPIEVIFNIQYYFTSNRIHTTIMILIIIIVLFIISSIVIQLMYSQAFYILADNPKKSTFACIQESRFLMRGNKLKYIGLHLSFIGWYILILIISVIGSFLLGSVFSDLLLLVGLLLLEPYIELTKANFYINAN